MPPILRAAQRQLAALDAFLATLSKGGGKPKTTSTAPKAKPKKPNKPTARTSTPAKAKAAHAKLTDTGKTAKELAQELGWKIPAVTPALNLWDEKHPKQTIKRSGHGRGVKFSVVKP